MRQFTSAAVEVLARSTERNPLFPSGLLRILGKVAPAVTRGDAAEPLESLQST